MSDEQDSWVQNTFGVSVPKVLENAEQTVFGRDEMGPPNPGVELEHPTRYDAPTYPNPGVEPEYPMPPGGYDPNYGPPAYPPSPPSYPPSPPSYPPSPPSYPSKPKPPGRKPYPPKQGPYPPSPPYPPTPPGPYPPTPPGPYPPSPGPPNQGPYPPSPPGPYPPTPPGPYPPSPGPQPPAPAPYPKERRTLYESMTGEDVKEAQTLLNKHGASLNPDGNFGPKTTTAVKAFQSSHPPLKADGKIGKQTWWALDAAYPPNPVPPYPPVPPPNPVPPNPIPPSPIPPVPVPPNPIPPVPPTPPDTKPRSVIFTVTSEVNNNAVAAAKVSVAGQSEKTGNTGQATFSLAPGKYPFAVAAEGFEPFTGNFEVTTNQETEHHVELKGGGPVPPPSPMGSKLRFKVLDFKANTGIEGATILIESSQGNTAEFTTKSATTDGNGNAGFILPPNSGTLTLDIRVTAEKFEDFRGVYKLPADGFDQEVHLKSKDRVHEINFWVFDNKLEELPGAKIEIAGKSHTTDKRGQVDVEVQPGPHPYIVTKEGFQPFNGKVDMPADEDVLEKVRMVAQGGASKSGGVFIRVIDSATKKPIDGAEFTIGGISDTSAAGGIIDIIGLEVGKQRFTLTKDGYATVTGSIVVKEVSDSEGKEPPQREDIEMKPETPKSISIRVMDGESLQPIDGVSVEFGSLGSKTSDAKGNVEFAQVPPGTYRYRATAKEYEPASEEITLTDKTKSSSPIEIRLLKLSSPDLNGSKIDHAKLKGPFDLTKLREDLTKTANDVQAALNAEKTMRSTASSAGIDLDKPEQAAQAMKFKLTDDDKDKLKAALSAVKNTRGDMVNIAHQMQGKESEISSKSQDLKAKFPGKLEEDFWKGLEIELAGAGEEIVTLLDMGLQVLATAKDFEHGPVLAIIEGVAGSHAFEHLIHHEKDKSEALKLRISAVAEKINIMIDKLGKATVKEVLDLQANLEDLKADYANKQKDYAEEYSHYAKLVARLSSKAGNAIPPEFAKTHTAVVNAALLSQTARNLLPTQSKQSVNPSGSGSLPKDKAKFYLIYWNQFHPMGQLIFDGPDTGLPGSVKGNMVVYQKGADQFAFRETRQSLQRLAQQLDPVKQLFESGKKLDELYKKWTNALSE